MRTITCASPAEATTLVEVYRAEMAKGRAVWGITHTPGTAVLKVRGFDPVIDDIRWAARKAGTIS